MPPLTFAIKRSDRRSVHPISFSHPLQALNDPYRRGTALGRQLWCVVREGVAPEQGAVCRADMRSARRLNEEWS